VNDDHNSYVPAPRTVLVTVRVTVATPLPILDVATNVERSMASLYAVGYQCEVVSVKLEEGES
jgi:hypothetical protein